MEIYETNEMDFTKSVSFLNWFENEIGTEIELNEVSEDLFYLMCYDLTPKEVKKVREFENKLADEK
ncbi:MAG: hypothetical protein QM490_01875 [Candidatus Gracilibacteria bacterium]